MAADQSKPDQVAWPPTFVSPPSSELECPICLLLMREPHLTSCCGNHFCSACICEVRKRGDPCPLCKAEVFHTLLNRKEKCRITELKVGGGLHRGWAGGGMREGNGVIEYSDTSTPDVCTTCDYQGQHVKDSHSATARITRTQ